MVIAALVSFGLLLVAWILAPSDAREAGDERPSLAQVEAVTPAA